MSGCRGRPPITNWSACSSRDDAEFAAFRTGAGNAPGWSRRPARHRRRADHGQHLGAGGLALQRGARGAASARSPSPRHRRPRRSAAAAPLSRAVGVLALEVLDGQHAQHRLSLARIGMCRRSTAPDPGPGRIRRSQTQPVPDGVPNTSGARVARQVLGRGRNGAEAPRQRLRAGRVPPRTADGPARRACRPSGCPGCRCAASGAGVAHQRDDARRSRFAGHACWMLITSSSATRASSSRVRSATRLQRAGPLHVLQRHHGLRGQHAHQVGVAVVQAAELLALEVDVQEAGHPVARHQRGHQAERWATGSAPSGPWRSRSMRASASIQPGPDGLQQLVADSPGGSERPRRSASHRPGRRPAAHALRPLSSATSSTSKAAGPAGSRVT